MITPDEIRKIKIRTVNQGGYDIDEVNELLDQIADSYSAIFEENKELFRKMEILAAKIEEYRDEEDSIKTALITAQKTADLVTNQAKEQAEEELRKSTNSAEQVVTDAKIKAQKLVEEAKAFVERIKQEKSTQAKTLVTDAESKANEAISSAKIISQDIIDQAKKLSEELVSKAREEKEFHDDIVAKLKSETTMFRENLISLYEDQLESLKDPRILASKVISEKAEAEENIAETQKDIENIISEINEVEVANVVTETLENKEENQIKSQQNENVTKQEEIVYQDISSNSNNGEIADLNNDEKIENIATAVDAFSADEITPIDDSAGQISEICEDAEMECDLPFNAFLSKPNPSEYCKRTNEKISLIPPEDDEDDEGENKKFKGFFKKKK